jgi:acetyltransferase-like isoleucine patch superfamily enzyme
MSALADQLAGYVRSRWFAAHGVRLGPGCKLGRMARVMRGFREGRKGRVEVGAGSELQTGAVLDAWGGSIVLGRHVFVGPYAVIYGHGGVEIGDQTLISMHCCVVSSNHSIPPLGVDIRSQPDALRPTRIGRDVWLGAGAIVLGGATIGDGCVVGAGAVVSGVLPANSIAHGVPARVVRQRA